MEGLGDGRNPVYLAVDGEWSSSDPAVLRVDNTGMVTAVASGRATLRVPYTSGIQFTLQAEITVSSDPVPLRFVEFASGERFTCGRTTTQTYCWGERGEIGTTVRVDRCSQTNSFSGGGATYTQRTVFPCAMEPVAVNAPAPFTALSAQGTTVCGLTADGRVYCWGANATFTSSGSVSVLPVLVNETLRFASFTGQCGVTTTNEWRCWGVSGMRGSTDTVGASSQVAGGAVWRSIGAAGTSHRCGVQLDGTVACWGANGRGQLGTGDLLSSLVPVPIKSSERFSAVIAGGNNTCALSVAGVVYCWGEGNSSPTAVAAAQAFTSISGDPSFRYCALASDGAAYCHYLSGLLSAEPTDLRFSAFQGTPDHECGLSLEGRLYCWGDNAYGQVGAGDQDYIFGNQLHLRPTLVTGQ